MQYEALKAYQTEGVLLEMLVDDSTNNSAKVQRIRGYLCTASFKPHKPWLMNGSWYTGGPQHASEVVCRGLH